MIPVRCFTCGKPIAHLFKKYKDLVAKGAKPSEAFKKLGVNRYCCKGILTSHVELIDLTASYRKF